MASIDHGRPLTIDEAADYCGFHANSIRGALDHPDEDERLTSFKPSPQKVIIFEADLVTWLRRKPRPVRESVAS